MQKFYLYGGETKRPSNFPLGDRDHQIGAERSLSGKNQEEDHSSEGEYSPVQFISQLRGQFHEKGASPLLALAMAVVLFSMAGIPPLVGFFAKQAVLLAAVKNGFIFLALVGIITSVISAAYYLRVIKVMVFEEKINIKKFESDNQFVSQNKDAKALSGSGSSQMSNDYLISLEKAGDKFESELGLAQLSSKKIGNSISRESFPVRITQTRLRIKEFGEMSNSLSFSISILTVFILFFVFKPILILNLAHIMALSLFYL